MNVLLIILLSLKINVINSEIKVYRNGIANYCKSTSLQDHPDFTFMQQWDREMKPISFDINSSKLRLEQQEKLKRIASFLMFAGNVQFRIEGCSDPRGSVKYNYVLAKRRAEIVKKQLILLGIEPSRMDIISNGKKFFAGQEEGRFNHIPSWAYDRRVQFSYIKGGLSK